jgi:UDP-N-acetylmuramate--alanine ligase
MSGIAQLLLSRKVKVSGSDLKESRITEELKRLGADIFIGHNPANIKGADLVVYSSAIKENNPEFVQARQSGIPLIKRAQALADLMEGKTVITVSGSHGKTTTASLASCLLLQANLSPTLAVGGIFKNINTNAYLGDGKFFVAEADESDGSFLYYKPKYSIVTNIDYEHLDYYKSFENELNAFREFLSRTKEDGCVFACADDVNLKTMLKGYKNRYKLFGLSPDCDIYCKNIKFNGLSSEFDCFYEHKFLDRFQLSLGGLHNISNALSVIALGLELGIDLYSIKRTLTEYRGAGRRLDFKFKSRDYMVIDDYAHHPTEIKAALAAVKNLNQNRIIALFQPHRFSRTKLLLDDFSGCFSLPDEIIITDIYSANEQPIEGITGELLCGKINEKFPGKNARFLSKEAIIDYALEILRPGDLLITLGAGDIGKICDELVQKLKGKVQDKRTAEKVHNF